MSCIKNPKILTWDMKSATPMSVRPIANVL